MRVITCILASLCLTASAAAAGESLRHVEYAVTTQVDGRASTSHLVLELSDERADFHGRLLYDAFKVVPIAFDASGEVRASEAGAERPHDVRLAVKLLRDSQP